MFETNEDTIKNGNSSTNVWAAFIFAGALILFLFLCLLIRLCVDHGRGRKQMREDLESPCQEENRELREAWSASTPTLSSFEVAATRLSGETMYEGAKTDDVQKR